MNSIIRNIKQRRSIRRYTAKEISKKLIKETDLSLYQQCPNCKEFKTFTNPPGICEECCGCVFPKEEEEDFLVPDLINSLQGYLRKFDPKSDPDSWTISPEELNSLFSFRKREEKKKEENEPERKQCPNCKEWKIFANPPGLCAKCCNQE